MTSHWSKALWAAGLGAALTMALLGVVATAVPARRALAVDASRLMGEE